MKLCHIKIMHKSFESHFNMRAQTNETKLPNISIFNFVYCFTYSFTELTLSKLQIFWKKKHKIKYNNQRTKKNIGVYYEASATLIFYTALSPAQPLFWCFSKAIFNERQCGSLRAIRQPWNYVLAAFFW
jgi:hypothetical protein